MTTPVIVVHGGAGTVAEDPRASAVTGTRAAAAAGQAVLLAGGSAEAAVIAAVRMLEDDPGFNAGRGACMNADGCSRPTRRSCARATCGRARSRGP